mmetsp:Transcript_32414/g.92339  ORF Transcript_32414/g.92339 Transcript_32414/m.92339 type:complete len:216 (-) Transcript_32414:10-657(-)
MTSPGPTGTPQTFAMANIAAGSGFAGNSDNGESDAPTTPSRLNAGDNGGKPCGSHNRAWKCFTVSCVFRVTSAIGIRRDANHCAQATAPLMSCRVRRPSASISSTTAVASRARCGGIAAISRRMSRRRSTPQRRYISAKSKFGTVSVPSKSKTTPRNAGFSLAEEQSGALARAAQPHNVPAHGRNDERLPRALPRLRASGDMARRERGWRDRRAL